MCAYNKDVVSIGYFYPNHEMNLYIFPGKFIAPLMKFDMKYIVPGKATIATISTNNSKLDFISPTLWCDEYVSV